MTATTPACDTQTVEEVAARLGCSVNHLRTLERTGRLPFPSLRLGDGWLRFSRAAVDAYLGGRAYADALLATIDRQHTELAAVSAILAALTTDTAAGQRIIADALGALAETRRAVITTIGYTASPVANGAGEPASPSPITSIGRKVEGGTKLRSEEGEHVTEQVGAQGRADRVPAARAAAGRAAGRGGRDPRAPSQPGAAGRARRPVGDEEGRSSRQ